MEKTRPKGKRLKRVYSFLLTDSRIVESLEQSRSGNGTPVFEEKLSMESESYKSCSRHFEIRLRPSSISGIENQNCVYFSVSVTSTNPSNSTIVPIQARQRSFIAVVRTSAARAKSNPWFILKIGGSSFSSGCPSRHGCQFYAHYRRYSLSAM